jgi:hypothetical protein
MSVVKKEWRTSMYNPSLRSCATGNLHEQTANTGNLQFVIMMPAGIFLPFANCLLPIDLFTFAV